MADMTQVHPIFTGSEWTFEKIEHITEAIQQIADEELQLDYYPFRLEIISSEQMMDAYTSAGMPINYHHWSFGKQFISLHESYKRGLMGLAYEIVINSNPCIAYLMEENTMTMQTLVIAHAAFGHNAFMKNNYLFKEWTHADAILDYFSFARKYLADCEERYGMDKVARVLDACHALQSHGAGQATASRKLDLGDEEQRQRERMAQRERDLNVLWSTLPRRAETKTEDVPALFPEEPQSNILYFIEKNAPELPAWKREIIRIVRKIAQYFYPQRQTKVLNEGFATFTHHYIIHRLADKGLITPGAVEEFIHSHTNVIAQPDFRQMNPYALGFHMFMDIKRMCEHPTEEDRQWFPDLVDSRWLETIKFVAESFKDDSALLQFVSPNLIRQFRFFSLLDDDRRNEVEVTGIHNESGYRHVRRTLAAQYDSNQQDPLIEVHRVNRFGDRSLVLRHRVVNRRRLQAADAQKVLQHVAQLWGFSVELEIEIDDRIESGWRVGGD